MLRNADSYERQPHEQGRLAREDIGGNARALVQGGVVVEMDDDGQFAEVASRSGPVREEVRLQESRIYAGILQLQLHEEGNRAISSVARTAAMANMMFLGLRMAALNGAAASSLDDGASGTTR